LFFLNVASLPFLKAPNTNKMYAVSTSLTWILQ
jgi:hypothetical protein